MRKLNLSRRKLLQGVGLVGCSIAAHPLMTSVSFASAPGEARLVVIILRGGMDGLDVVQPVGDANFALSRPDLRSKSRDLDGYFALNDGLSDLRPLWKKGELGFVHAVSTPYRGKRSHFDGQDLLEAGMIGDAALGQGRDGWLNRLLQVMPGTTGETAFAIGRENLKILSGQAAVSNWAPNTQLNLSQNARQLLLEAYHNDPLFRASALEAMDLADMIADDKASAGAADDDMQAMMRSPGGVPERALAAFAADRLNHHTRIASFSINGWDTHQNQVGALGRRLQRLSETILTLKKGLGKNWGQTTVLAMTEFGRTARENGTAGTDHGTGGLMVLAGGAIAGDKVYGDWPGLAEADLYDRRDLMPTGDVRAIAAWAMRDMFGLDRTVLERSVFPNLDMGTNPGIIL
ncbi:MAG: DUF1501 domain-containing protein [Marinosulfonomonas sp.]|nr:DUF1501 domain-containing protein [Marinosulfonomonas sp.]